MSFVIRRGPFREPERTCGETPGGPGAGSGVAGASRGDCGQDNGAPAQAHGASSDVAPAQQLNKIAFVGDYVPRKCGIATFTHDIFTALARQYPNVSLDGLPERGGAGLVITVDDLAAAARTIGAAGVTMGDRLVVPPDAAGHALLVFVEPHGTRGRST